MLEGFCNAAGIQRGVGAKMYEMLSPISDKSDQSDQSDQQQLEQVQKKTKEVARRPLSLLVSKRQILNDPAASLRILNDPSSSKMAFNGSDSGISISANSLFSQHEALTMNARDAQHLSLDNSRGSILFFI